MGCYRVIFEVNGQKGEKYVKANNSDAAKGEVLLLNPNAVIKSVGGAHDSRCS